MQQFIHSLVINNVIENNKIYDLNNIAFIEQIVKYKNYISCLLSQIYIEKLKQIQNNLYCNIPRIFTTDTIINGKYSVVTINHGSAMTALDLSTRDGFEIACLHGIGRIFVDEKIFKEYLPHKYYIYNDVIYFDNLQNKPIINGLYNNTVHNCSGYISDDTMDIRMLTYTTKKYLNNYDRIIANKLPIIPKKTEILLKILRRLV
jgi:hypothetical protein